MERKGKMGHAKETSTTSSFCLATWSPQQDPCCSLQLQVETYPLFSSCGSPEHFLLQLHLASYLELPPPPPVQPLPGSPVSTHRYPLFVRLRIQV